MLQLGWGCATSRLDIKSDLYPYFLRVHPTQTRVTRDMVMLLDHLMEEKEARVNSVVLITSDSEYGVTGGNVGVLNIILYY